MVRVAQRVTLSTDDLNCVAGGLDEFASRTPMLMSLTRRYNFDGGGVGGTGASGSGSGGMTDMFSLLDGGGPGANSTTTGNGGTGAHGGSTLPNMTGTPSSGASGPYAGETSTGSGGAGTGSGFGGGILGSLGASAASLPGAGSVVSGGPGGAGTGPGGATSPLGALLGLHPSNPGSFGPGGVGAGPLGTGPGGYGPGGIGGTGPGGIGPVVGWNGANANGGDLSPYASSFIGTNTPGGAFGVGGTPGGQLGATMVTNSFEIRNWGDPHVNITINGQAMDQIDIAPSIDNFQVMSNTVGGATRISTETTHQEQVSQSFNKEIEIQGGSWTLEATNADRDGDVDVAIQSAYGTQILEVGQSMQQMDGTIITNQGDKLVVTQRLQDGGYVNTEITVNGAEYLDLKSTGQGNAGLGGFVYDQFAQGHQVQQNTTQATTGNLQQMLAARGWGS